MSITNGTVQLSPYSFTYAAVTHRGMLRQHNEDALLILNQVPVFCVADGAGGHESGALASQFTLQGIKTLLAPSELLQDETIPLPGAMESLPETMLESAILYANSFVYRKKKKQNMASTVVACHFAENQLYVAHVGDSRAYRLRDNTLDKLTEDHSLVNHLYRNGEITREEMLNHPRKNVLIRAMGIEEQVEVSSRETDYEDGDLYLLCSDGLTSMVAEERIEEIIRNHIERLSIGCQALLDHANSNGGRDNITIILIRVNSRSGGVN